MFIRYNKEIWKLLRSSLSIPQIVAFSLSACIGLFVLFFAVFCFIDFTKYIKKDTVLFAKEFIIVSKKVSALQTLTQKKAHFTQREIQEIQKQEFFTQVDVFETSQFQIQLFTDSDKLPAIKTDLFFEAVPNQYLNADFIDWHWKEGQTFIPIIFPQNFLSLYNYGFAPGQGLPQLSESVFTKIPLKIKITGNGLHQIYDARVVGFSQRINTILVPLHFLQWANKTYAEKHDAQVSRLIIECKNIANPKIFEYVSHKNFQINDESLVNSKLAFYLTLTLSIVGGIGILITLLAIWLLLFSFQLIIEKNKYTLQNLFYLGYTYSEISKPYRIFSMVLTVVLLILSLFVSNIMHNYVIQKLQILIEIPHPGILVPLITAIISFVVIQIIHTVAIQKVVKRAVQ